MTRTRLWAVAVAVVLTGGACGSGRSDQAAIDPTSSSNALAADTTAFTADPATSAPVVVTADSTTIVPVIAATDPAVTADTADDAVVAGEALSAGAWEGARTTDDGTGLVLFVVGGPEFDGSDPCTVRYVPSAEETAEAVMVTVGAERPPGNAVCTAVGYIRTVEIKLEQPIGHRLLIALGATRPVFDASTLFRPGWMPDGWQLLRETPGHPEPNRAQFWTRFWGSPRLPDTASSCTPSTSPLQLSQGAVDLVEQFPRELGETDVGTFDVNGATATYSTQVDHGIARLRWTTPDHGFVLKTAPSCVGDQPPTLDTMLTFARSLTSS